MLSIEFILSKFWEEPYSEHDYLYYYFIKDNFLGRYFLIFGSIFSDIFADYLFDGWVSYSENIRLFLVSSSDIDYLWEI